MKIIECPAKDMRGWKFIELTQGTEGRFIRIWKWYIKISNEAIISRH